MKNNVEVKNISFSYGKTEILKDLSLDIREGEFMVLLGPSGCGKTTLLNCIAGLLDLTDGQIWIEDDNVTWKEPKDRHIGMVFQSYALYPSMTVEKNLSFGLRMMGTAKDLLNEKIKKFNQFKKDFENKNFENENIKKIYLLIQKFNIDGSIIKDLFDGVETDLKESVTFVSKKELIIYSYRVAGTVGLMMAKILNVKSKNSLMSAIDLGIAMQLTNIARDVIEDKNRNRNYINSNFESELYLGIRPEDISLENKSEIKTEIKIDLIENLGAEKIIYTHINGTEIRIKSAKNIKDKNITIYLPKNKLYLFDNNKNRLKM